MSSPYLDFLTSIPELGRIDAEKAASFAEILYRENEKQNLTRILGPRDFYFGHLLDVLKLFDFAKTFTLGSRVADLGSGCGVPGLLAALLDADLDRRWLLIESEIQKAEYLKRAAIELGLSNVDVIHGRIEATLSSLRPTTLLARALGDVERIASWAWQCSTWNNLVLFKGPSWKSEWELAQKSRFGKKLTLANTFEYSADGRARSLVSLQRK